MINVEAEIFNTVAQQVRAVYPSIFMTGEHLNTPSSFPCVSLIEMDNAIYNETSDSGNTENHAQVMYEVNIYSNKTTGKKSECKNIAAIIDTAFIRLGFTRMVLTPIQNVDGVSIYRMVGRYRAIVSKDKIVYRR